MTQFDFKIYIPYRFALNNSVYRQDCYEKEFTINDIEFNLHLNISREEKDCYLTAKCILSEETYLDSWVLMFDIAEILVGKALQLFFNGVSKECGGEVFYNVFDGHRITLAYEVSGFNRSFNNERKNIERSYYMTDENLNEAIAYANNDNKYLKKTFSFLIEGKSFLKSGRFESAIIQFSMMYEFLINHLLSTAGYINMNGEFVGGHESKCNEAYKIETGEENGIPFSYAKYVYGLSLINKKICDNYVEWIDTIYKLRNRIAHGKTLAEAFDEMDYDFGDSACNNIDQNIYNFMIEAGRITTEIFNFFADLL